MNRKKIVAAVAVIVVVSMIQSVSVFASDIVKAAEAVVERTFGTFPKHVVFKNIETRNGHDVYTLAVSKGKLTVEGSSAVALCKGFHDYLLENGYGIVSWTGNRIALPKHLPDMTKKEVESPYRYHLFFNVCTFGYTMPFWKWNEWERQIDWMAMHGFDMPLSPVGGETILARVWKKLGLTDEEIREYFTGPAHMPWMRMGNMAHFQGNMSDKWFEEQIELEHKINARELELGMTPVYQGFAGFVPKALKTHYPEAQLTEMIWSKFAPEFHNHMLSPLDPLFTKIGVDFINEWEKEFGKGKYYLIDSFNEMDIPFGKQGSQERYDALHRYGATIYNTVREANPDAVWVMQGWMFGYQRKLWDPESVKALLSGAPDDKMMIIDLAVDFNEYVWKSTRSWDYLSGFFGKEWTWSTTPNFGGRSALLGPLDFYLNEQIVASTSPNRGNLAGYGTSPEGIENNEIVYEVISSAGWSSEKKDLMGFLKDYTAARYGSAPSELMTFWSEMLQSQYGNFTNNGRFCWQRRPRFDKPQKMNVNEHYYRAIESYLSAAEKFRGNSLYETDAIMYAAFYLAAHADDVLMSMYKALDDKDAVAAESYRDQLVSMLSDVDRLLESHPILKTERWMDMARAAGTSPEEGENFVIESKRLISTWGGSALYDYSCRIWSGIIRDYYIPRLKYYADTNIEALKKAGSLVNADEMKRLMADFDEKGFPQTLGLSPQVPFADPVKASCELVKKYFYYEKNIL